MSNTFLVRFFYWTRTVYSWSALIFIYKIGVRGRKTCSNSGSISFFLIFIFDYVRKTINWCWTLLFVMRIRLKQTFPLRKYLSMHEIFFLFKKYLIHMEIVHVQISFNDHLFSITWFLDFLAINPRKIFRCTHSNRTQKRIFGHDCQLSAGPIFVENESKPSILLVIHATHCRKKHFTTFCLYRNGRENIFLRLHNKSERIMIFC
jgi:hypothetical protein